jgi:hypothetical protein
MASKLFRRFQRGDRAPENQQKGPSRHSIFQIIYIEPVYWKCKMPNESFMLAIQNNKNEKKKL